jgi:hypothetical protein
MKLGCVVNLLGAKVVDHVVVQVLLVQKLFDLRTKRKKKFRHFRQTKFFLHIWTSGGTALPQILHGMVRPLDRPLTNSPRQQSQKLTDFFSKYRIPHITRGLPQTTIRKVAQSRSFDADS